MGPITEHHLLIFLLQFGILLGVCKLLGRVFERFNQSTVTAEILVGLIFGATVLGKFTPLGHAFIFPNEDIQRSMLDTVAWFGNFFLLLETGMEINFTQVWKQKGNATIVTFADLIIPIMITFVPIYLLPDHYLVDPGKRIPFALFLSTIMTISALPVAIRGMRDMNILKTDMGFLIISALTLNDLVGWVMFTIILGIFANSSIEVMKIIEVGFLTLAFTVGSLTLGKALVGKAMDFLHNSLGDHSGYKTAFIFVIGMLFGAATLAIGIHSLFGFFIAGIVLGEARRLSEKDRFLINRMVYSIFVPIFFANIGLHLDFLAHFDWMLVLLLFGIGIVGRYFGAWVGAKLARQKPCENAVIAVCHTPGGQMHIVVAMLAYSSGLITDTVFVSIIASAILSTIVFGPWLTWAVTRMNRFRMPFRFSRDHVITDAASPTRESALGLLSQALSRQTRLPETTLLQEIMLREEQMSTALGDGIAIPHARLEGITESRLLYLKHYAGLDWNSPDDRPVRHVFLIVTPREDATVQLLIMRNIAEALGHTDFMADLNRSDSAEELWKTIHNRLATQVAE